MSRRCSIKFCKATNREKRFYKLPKDETRRARWLEAIGEHLKEEKRNNKSFEVCELHFESNFILGSKEIYKCLYKPCHIRARQRQMLAKTAIPTIFPVEIQSELGGELEKNDPENEVKSESVVNIEDNECEDEPMLYDQENEMNTLEDEPMLCFKENVPNILEEPSVDTSAVHNDETTHARESQFSLQPSKYEVLKNDLSILSECGLPNYWQYIGGALGPLLLYLGDSKRHASRSIFIEENMNLEIRTEGRIIHNSLLPEQVSSVEDIINVMEILGNSKICIGFGEHNHCPKGFFVSDPSKTRCSMCKKLWAQKNRKSKQNMEKKRRIKIREKKLRNIKKRNIRLELKIKNAKESICELQKACATASEEAVDKSIANFPEEQREAIKCCFTAATLKSSHGIRYTNKWVLQCLFLRIKSRRAYMHILNHKILPVPTITTLNRYIRGMKPSYGFSTEVFNLMKLKVSHMKVEERRGCLVVDEMRLSEALSFDSSDLLFKGFTDLGEHTPSHQKNKRGDEGLVFMFQPFRGSWVQTIGAFLSKGCASGVVLQRLITEAIIHLENAGLFVDVVTSDGATWNRAMWKNFGLKKFENSCEHPFSTTPGLSGNSRKLYFCSDFSHLAKNFRNFITASETTWTPEGMVKLAHFRALLLCDAGNSDYSLKVAPKLTLDHIHPKPLQKMNVGMAYQLFSPQVAAGLKMYNAEHTDLSDCEATITLVERFHKLIEAMTSRSTFGALSFSSTSYQTIVDFITYIEMWHDKAANEGHRFLSTNTFEGIIVTLKTTLDLLKFLEEECGYSYLMTARLNQDALERFFGMLRSACGSSDHPDSVLFIQVYRLLSLYSLVKPPKGSNVEGHEIFDSLLTIKDVVRTDNKTTWHSIMDTVTECKSSISEDSIIHDHSYSRLHARSQVQTYVAGFIARKIKIWTKCETCIATSVKLADEATIRDEMIALISKGFLTYPSTGMFHLLSELEQIIERTLSEQESITCFSFLDITKHLVDAKLPFIGCPLHKHALTKRVINYYMLCRARMISKSFNKSRNETRKTEISLRKQSKLVRSSQGHSSKDCLFN